MRRINIWQEDYKKKWYTKKNLWDDSDSIMADRGFTIQNEIAPLNAELNIPSFLGSRAQLTEAEVKEIQTVASV